MRRRTTPSLLFVLLLFIVSVPLLASSSYDYAPVVTLSSETPPPVALAHHNDKGHRLQIEAQALLSFKSKITDDPKDKLANWNLNNTHNLCSNNSWYSWYGVTCTSHPPFTVISLVLYGLGLTGSISASLFNLTSLQTLDLSMNNLMGEIPLCSGRCSSLHTLHLSFNNLEGEIPSCMGRCTSLVSLILSGNSLSGHIPLSLANLTSLQELYLPVNNLVGEVPQGLSKCSRLEQLDLRKNLLSGTIPSSLGNLSHLQYLALGGASHDDEKDNLSGLIPPQLGKLRHLWNIYIHGDYIVGSLPAEFGNLTKLERLGVNARNLDVNLLLLPNLTRTLQYLSLSVSSFSGKIPAEIGSFESLYNLELAGTVSSAGGIPQELCKLSLLLHLTLDHMEVGGQIPHCIANMTQLEELRLPENRLEGELFAGIFSNLSLNTLDLSSNTFNKILPQLGSNLEELIVFNNSFRWPSKVELPSSLRIISAHSNNFSRPLPQSLGNCTELLVLDFRSNRVSGQLLDYLKKMQQLWILQLGYNNLEGFIPNWISNLTRLHILDLSNNKFKGNIPHTLLSIRGFLQNSSQEDIFEEINDGIKDANVMEKEKGLELLRKYMPKDNRVIDLSANNLTGQIPSCIGNLNGLRLLNLSHNMLKGEIPASISNMTNLEELDLNSNQLKGVIPSQLLKLTFLSSFNVSNNLLCGRTPTGEQFNTFDETCFQGNKCLCGYSPQHQCAVPQHGKGTESTEQKQVKKTWFDKIEDKVSILGVGLGFGLAFGGTWALYFLWEPFQKFFGYLGI